jgi:hypothetical protein
MRGAPADRETVLEAGTAEHLSRELAAVRTQLAAFETLSLQGELREHASKLKERSANAALRGLERELDAAREDMRLEREAHAAALAAAESRLAAAHMNGVQLLAAATEPATEPAAAPAAAPASSLNALEAKVKELEATIASSARENSLLRSQLDAMRAEATTREKEDADHIAGVREQVRKIPPFSPYVAPRFPHMSEINSREQVRKIPPFSPYVAPRFAHMSRH